MFRTTAISALLIAFAGMTASAQVNRIQQGNVLDVNPRVGSGGINYAVPRGYTPNTGNLIMSGNVTGGGSFRGFSPIRNPSSLMLGLPNAPSSLGVSGGLPSEALTSFRRDTFSIADVQQGRTMTGGISPFYSSSGTVTNTGAIAAGLNRPGTSQVMSQYAPLRTNMGPQMVSPLSTDVAGTGGTLMNVPSVMMRVNSGQAVAGPTNPGLLSSSLFSNFRAVPITAVRAEATTGQALGNGQVAPLDQRVSRYEPLDRRVVAQPAEQGAPPRSLLDRILGPENPSQVGAPSAGVPQGPSLATPLSGGQAGGDVFEGMRNSMGQARRPLEAGATGEGSSLMRPIGEPARTTGQEPTEAAGPLSDEPEVLRSFAGTEQSAVNRYLADAELMLKAGQFYRAASTYEMAHTIAPQNPLPQLGRAMSLLAAGDYRTSAMSLLSAIRLYQPLANYRVDLQAFIPDVKALDRRRADLEQRLDIYDDAELRFLLGFAEYSSGLAKEGLQNMSRAAAASPERLAPVQGFLDLVQRRANSTSKPAGK